MKFCLCRESDSYPACGWRFCAEREKYQQTVWFGRCSVSTSAFR